MKNSEIIAIAVIGTRQPSTKEHKIAEEVGRELAKNGVVLLCGGLGGVMESACRGASSEGGLTIGILPGNEASSANQYVQIPIVTGLGYARNAVLVKSARAVIAVGGGYGTLSEIAYALDSNIPVIGINTWSLARNGQEDNSIIIAKNARDAVRQALKLMKKDK
jgi:uncharacterized protein (TIGR00725 family)